MFLFLPDPLQNATSLKAISPSDPMTGFKREDLRSKDAVREHKNLSKKIRDVLKGRKIVVFGF
ncbi:hypothetical protein CH380_11445 [Leptospira adleri]|uniref:Uncharacterized protein n=1 Tax=Leptospira adleri TaxID=2023186 RepID=A0A2M9YN94_9LEPT|nr:hypothetical protein CH380_11445 [Leptospira adleri]PJZ62585.1 hypothetical protein CH376_07225 [Leptospira adleri]